MDIRFFAAIAATCGMFPLQAALVPGEPAPDLAVRDRSGAVIRLSAYKQNRHVALLALSPERAAAIDSSGTSRRLLALDTVILFQDGPESTVLIDREGMVRRVEAGHVLTGADLENFVAVWQSGKAVFGAYCGRCRGADGGDTWCDPNPLTGVSHRLSPGQIREALRITEINDQLMIRGEMYKRSEIDAIIVYLRGL